MSYKTKAGDTCASILARFKNTLSEYSLEWMNRRLGAVPACPGLQRGMNLCVGGMAPWLPDTPWWNLTRVPPGGKPRPGLTYNYCRDDRNGPLRMALTFDDGPAETTGALLDILKREGIKATFFVNGRNRRCIYGTRERAILRRIAREGHQIGTHTTSHPTLTDIYARYGEAAALAEIDRTQRAVQRLTGYLPRYFRFPYGVGGNEERYGRMLKKRGLIAAGWTIATSDAGITLDTYTPPAGLVRSLTRRAFYNAYFGQNVYEPGSRSHVVLMHDWVRTTVSDLVPWVIRQGRELGYEFVTVAECLGDGPEDWYQGSRTNEADNPSWNCPEDETPPRCWPWEPHCLEKPGAVTLRRPWR